MTGQIAEIIAAIAAASVAIGAGGRQLFNAAQAVSELTGTVRGLTYAWRDVETRLAAHEAAHAAAIAKAPAQ